MYKHVRKLVYICVLCASAALPSMAQNASLENALVRAVANGHVLSATQDLQQTIIYMQGVITTQERDGVLRMATQAILAGADVRAEFTFADGTTRTVLENIVEGGIKYNAAHFANLYNLVVANGANPEKDLRGQYATLAQQLPLEQSQAWQEIANNTLAPITPATQTPKQYVNTRSVTIHIPDEYNKYSCRKLASMQEKGTLPSPTVSYGEATRREVQEPSIHRSNKQVTIVIPEAYNEYSCRKLASMQKEGTLPKPTVVYSTK